MLKKKIITFLIVGGMVANIGLAANAYTRSSAPEYGINNTYNHRVACTGVNTTGSGVTTTGSGVTTTDSGVTTTGSGVTTTDSGVTTTGSGVTTTGSGVTTTGSGVTTTGSGVTTTGSGVTTTGSAWEAKFQKVLKAKLDVLVTAGTITKVQEDKVIAAYEARDTIGVDPLAELVASKTITQAQADKVLNVYKLKNINRIDPLAVLVAAGTITQAQSDVIKAVVPGKYGNHGIGFGRGSAMHQGESTTPDAIQVTPPAIQITPDVIQVTPDNIQVNIKTQLDALVKSSLITQAQENKIISYLNGKGGKISKVKNMTKAKELTLLSSLVKTGTISQAQSDVFKNIFFKHNMGKKMVHSMNNRRY